MTYPFSWHDGIVQDYLSSFFASSTWDKNPSDSCKKNTSLSCNNNFPVNQFIPCQSSCILKQHIRRSWSSESSNLILNDEMNLAWVSTVSRDTGYWLYTSEAFHQLVKSQTWLDCVNDQFREEKEITSNTGGWSSLLLSDRRGMKSNWYNNRSSDKTSVWMKDRRVIELTFNWPPNFSIETMINLERTKALDEGSNSESTHYSAFTECANYGNHRSR